MSRTPHLYGATFALIYNENNEVLLMQRINTGYYDGGWSLPAGHIENKELMTESMIHECKEELGIDVEITTNDICHILHRINPDRQYFDICFAITKRTGDIENKEPEKCSMLQRFDIENLPEYITHEARRFIFARNNKLTYSEMRVDE